MPVTLFLYHVNRVSVFQSFNITFLHLQCYRGGLTFCFFFSFMTLYSHSWDSIFLLKRHVKSFIESQVIFAVCSAVWCDPIHVGFVCSEYEMCHCLGFAMWEWYANFKLSRLLSSCIKDVMLVPTQLMVLASSFSNIATESNKT